MKLPRTAFLAAATLAGAATVSTSGQTPAPPSQPPASAAPSVPAWVARSNQHAKTLLTVMAVISGFTTLFVSMLPGRIPIAAPVPAPAPRSAS